MKRSSVIAMIVVVLTLVLSRGARADDLLGTVSKVTIPPNAVSAAATNVRASVRLRVSGPTATFVWINLVGGVSETAPSPILNRREWTARMAIIAAARNDAFGNPIQFRNLVRIFPGVYQANRTTTMETTFRRDTRWVGATQGNRTSHSFADQTITADRILGVGITKEPGKPFDVEYVIVRIGREFFNVLCMGDPAGVQLDVGIRSTTPLQRESLLMLASQYSGRMHFMFARQFGNSGFFLHDQSLFERLD